MDVSDKIMGIAAGRIASCAGRIDGVHPYGPILIDQELLDSGFDYFGIAPHTFIVQLKPEDIIDRPDESAKLLAAFGREESRRFRTTWTSGSESDEDAWYTVEEGVRSWLESIFSVKGCIGNISLLIMDKRVVGGSGAIASANPRVVVDDIVASIGKYVGLSDDTPDNVRRHYQSRLNQVGKLLEETAVSRFQNMIGYSQLFVSSDRVIPILESADNVERLWGSIVQSDTVQKGQIEGRVYSVFQSMLSNIASIKDTSIEDRSRYIYRLLSVALALLPMVDLTERVNSNRMTLGLPPMPTLVACWTQTEIPHNKMAEILDQFGQIDRVFGNRNILSRLYLVSQTRSLRPIPNAQLENLLALGNSYKQVARVKLVEDSDIGYLRSDTSGKSEVVSAIFGFREILNVLSDIRLTTALLSGNPRHLRLLRNVSEQ